MTSRKVTIKNIDILSSGNMIGMIFAVIGLIADVFVVLAAILGSQDMGSEIMLAIFLPIFCGVFGFIAGIINALIYNDVAKLVGGLELEFKYNDNQL